MARETLRGRTKRAEASLNHLRRALCDTEHRLVWLAGTLECKGEENLWRAVIEIGFIIFLFYSNLLMGEFTRSGTRRVRGLAWAIGDIFTMSNFLIAAIAALIGYLVVESLRNRL